MKANLCRIYVGLIIVLCLFFSVGAFFFGPDAEAEGRELTCLIADWLKTLGEDDRIMFVRRYWYGYSLKEIAGQTFSATPYLASRMFELRKSLRAWLEKEGVTI